MGREKSVPTERPRGAHELAAATRNLALFLVIWDSCLKHHSAAGAEVSTVIPSHQSNHLIHYRAVAADVLKAQPLLGGRNLAPMPALLLKTESSCSRAGAGAPNYLLHYRLSLLFALIRACCLFSFQKKSPLKFPESVTAHSYPSPLAGHPDKVQRLAAVPSACFLAQDPSPLPPSLSIYTPTHSLIN